MNKEERCKNEVIGHISRTKMRGLDSSSLIFVQYEVDGCKYELIETIKLRKELIKIGFLPIGTRGIPIMGDTRVGSPARVMYNPAKPSQAYLPDNKGIINV